MASNLPGRICIGQFNACILRVAALDADCAPVGGANGGIVTAALVDLTADPDIEEGTRVEPKNGCGQILYTYEDEPRVKRYNLSGNMGFFDYEAMAMMFGGDLILGKGTGLYSGEVIGYAERAYTAAKRNGVYLEVIVQNGYEGGGDCSFEDTTVPSYTGHIFGRAKLVRGPIAMAEGAHMVQFTGTGNANPSLFNGPWNDYPGAGYAPNRAHFEVGYSQAEYDAIAAVVGCGYSANLPAGS